MDWKDLPKQKQLLIYMLNKEASTTIPFTIAGNGDEVVANGISANKHALANMLYTLCQKKQIEVHGKNGTFGYLLTKDGQDEAEYWMAQCDSDMEVPESTDSLCETEERYRNIEAYAKRLEQIIVGLKDELFKLNDQPKQFDGLVKAQAKEIERLKAALKNAKTENDNLRVSEKIVRDAAEYFDAEQTKLRNERERLLKSLYSIDTRRKALAKENEDLSIKILTLRKSLASAMADLDKKNKRIEHLEDSIDKLKCSLTKMAEWAEKMKNGSN